MSFFSEYNPNTLEIDISGEKIKLADLFSQIRIDDFAPVDSSKAFRFLDVQDGERPDTISFLLYGTEKYYWTLFLINDHLREGSNRWPRSTSELNRRIEKTWSKYSVITFIPGISATDFQESEESFDYEFSIPFGTEIENTGYTFFNLLFAFPFQSCPFEIKLSGEGSFEKKTFTYTFPIIFGEMLATKFGKAEVAKDDDLRYQIFIERNKDIPLAFFASEWYKINFDNYDSENEEHNLWLQTHVVQWYNILNTGTSLSEKDNPFTIINAVRQVKFYPSVVHLDGRNAKSAANTEFRKIDLNEPLPQQFKWDPPADLLSYAEVEHAVNDANRQIRVINPEIIDTVAENIKLLYNER